MTDEEKRYRLQAVYNDPESTGLERLNAATLLSQMDKPAAPPAPVISDPWSELEAKANFAVLFMSQQVGVPITPTGLEKSLVSLRELLMDEGWNGIRPDIRAAWNAQQES